MSTLFTVFYGKSKKRMKPIMTDIYRKCENYVIARQNVIGFHKIVEALPGENVWKQKSCTVGGNKCHSVNRVGHGRSGYISKRGFQEHT
jgi:hypothetical protein